MNYILHLTDSCNLNCKYCYQNKSNNELFIENIKHIIDYEIKQKNKISNKQKAKISTSKYLSYDTRWKNS